MINLIIVGIGDLATKIIPAIKKLEDKKQVKNVIFVDTKPVEKILEAVRIPKLRISKDLYEWFEMQKSHIILHDDGNNSILMDKIRNHIAKDDVKTAVYLATPPIAYHSCVIKYNEIAQIFFLEKPWADDPSQLEQTLKLAGNKKIMGIDHYLWKESVRGFLKNNKNIMKLESGNFDFVIAENLPPKFRKYYWDYGETADMMPHVLPLLDKLFNMQTTVLDSKEFKFRCAIWNPKDLEYVDNNNRSVINKETFIEIEALLEKRIIHIVLGKGIKFFFKSSGISKFFSNSNELLINFEEEDIVYNNIFRYISQNIDKIVEEECKEFLDANLMKKYVNKIDELQKMIDKKYNVSENRIGRSVSLQEHPDLIYCKNKNIRLQYHKGNNCKIQSKKESETDETIINHNL